MSARPLIALTGAGGSLAGDVLDGLVEAGYTVRCLDRVAEPDDLGPHRQWLRCDITDESALDEAFAECEAVIHLGGIPLEDSWERLLRDNIDGTYHVLAAAHRQRVRRVVLASSIHAVGFHPTGVDPRAVDGPPNDAALLPADIPVFPNTLYGVSKAALEALGRYFSGRFGLEVVCLRIASRTGEPTDERMLSTWMSPADATRLLLASLRGALDEPFQFVWGISANTRRYLSLDPGRRIGYDPCDNAERYAERILAQAAEDRQPWELTLGGIFSSDHPPAMPHRPPTASASSAVSDLTSTERSTDR